MGRIKGTLTREWLLRRKAERDWLENIEQEAAADQRAEQEHAELLVRLRKQHAERRVYSRPCGNGKVSMARQLRKVKRR